jgi:hypothetical protein
VQIYFNNQKINFTLEQEKTLADVVHSLELWFYNQKMFIVSLEVDQKEFSPKDLEQQGLQSIDKIDEIKITASDFLKLETDGVKSLIPYFKDLTESMKAFDETTLAELLQQFPAMFRTLEFVFASRQNEMNRKNLSALDKTFTGTTVGMISLWNEGTKQTVLSLCDYFLTEAEKINSSYKHIGQASIKITRETLSKLRDIIIRLSEVSILLQTGKDSEAMQVIASFSEMTQLFLHLISDFLAPQTARSISIGGESIVDFSRTLNIQLRELIEAFEKKDFILIGDLCEYEIAPKIIKLLDNVEQALPA